MTKTTTCETCRFWRRDSDDPNDGDGQCRRHAPTGDVGAWPSVEAYECCGEHSSIGDAAGDIVAAIGGVASEVADLRRALVGKDRDTICASGFEGELTYICRAIGELVSSGHAGDLARFFGEKLDTIAGNISVLEDTTDELVKAVDWIGAHLPGEKRPARSDDEHDVDDLLDGPLGDLAFGAE